MINKQNTQLPPWGNDPLSKLLANAQHNERAVSLNYPELFLILQHLNDTFINLQRSTEKDDDEERLIPRMLLIRGYSNCIAAIRLAMSGQFPESCAILRVAIETGWYALHLAHDPNPPTRRTIWIKRGDNAQAAKQCANEFRISNVRSTHLDKDLYTAQELDRLYNTMIRGGGHPNDISVLGMMKIRESSDRKLLLDQGVLNPDLLLIKIALKHIVAVGVGICKIAQQIFPERLDLIQLNENIHFLVKAINTASSKQNIVYCSPLTED